MKRLLGILLVMMLLMTACSVPDRDPGEDAAPDESSVSSTAVPTPTPAPQPAPTTLRLPCQLSDSMNPFVSQGSINEWLWPLLYGSLVQIENDYTATLLLASDIVFDADQGWLVTVREEVLFSDGTPLTPEDVVLSLNSARTSERFAASLSGITGVRKLRNGIVCISVSGYDPGFVNLLDFPIVKYGTQRSELPIGTGPFVLSQWEEGTPVLEPNPYHPEAASFILQGAELHNVNNTMELLLYHSIGALDLVVTDLLPGDMNSVGVAAYVDQNRLLYLGMNRFGTMSRYELRRAAALVLDRGDILKEAYLDAGAAAYTVFNPRVKGYEKCRSGLWDDLSVKPPAMPSVMYQYLQSWGYTTHDEEGYLTREGGRRFTLRLLINGDNHSRVLAADSIVRQFKDAGVEVLVDARPYARYLTALANLDFDLYLGEVRLNSAPDLSPLFDYKGSAVYGLTSEDTLAYAYAELRAGLIPVKDFITRFEEELPFIPLLYHDTAVVYSRSLRGVSPTLHNVFAGVERWAFEDIQPD